MKLSHILITISFLLLTLASSMQAQDLALVPKPVELKKQEGTFLLDKHTTITYAISLAREAEFFTSQIKVATGLDIKRTDTKTKQLIELKLDNTINESIGEEGYQLVVEKKKVTITAKSNTGIFYGLQSLLQLLPDYAFSRVNTNAVSITIPCVSIVDYPRFKWRGFMMDASRSFQSVAYLKKTIDLMAMHKMNVLHWHLTDDHGWRIEIKKYPWLSEKGAWRKQPNYPVKGEMGNYGGYYTQKQIRELVKYAAERHITIVPEVDLPGHSSALLWAMPELSCDSVEQQQHMQYFRDYPMRSVNYIRHRGTNVICAGKESVYPVIEDIIDEIISLFPSEYIHVGGDEVDKKWWSACPHCQKGAKKERLNDMDELQAYFINRVEKMVNARGRKLIGWDEILEGGLSESASVMAWRNIEGAKKSLDQGRKTVVAAHQGYYIQENQTTNPFHPQGWPRINTAREVYEFNPVPKGTTAAQEEKILGIQTSVWTPFMHNDQLLDIALYPRNVALSEAAWVDKNSKDWENFEARLHKHLKRLNYLGVAYWREDSVKIGSWQTNDLWKQQSVLTFDISKELTKPGVYFVLGDMQEGAELIVEKAIVLENGKQIAHDVHIGLISKEKNHDRIYFMDIQRVDKTAKYELQLQVKGTLGKVSKGDVYLLKP
ncbi:MAG: beta-N-acetylhexosaminidase [Carboxylicivirga sp.]|nr:beta-N-acetylhexosaminidase [Carboxylicivirga sp.]